MPISKANFLKFTLLAILVGSLALLAIVGVTVFLVDQTRTSADAVRTARVNRTAVVALRGLLQDAETGQRGYLLTENPDYLKPYLDAQAGISGQLAQVRASAADDPTLQPLTEKLAGLTEAKMAELKQTIDLAQANQRDAALDIVRANRGKDIMDQARAVFDQMIARTETILDQADERQRETTGLLRTVTLLGALLIVTVLGGYTLMVLRYTRELITAEQTVQALNAGLEDRVRERTADLGRANEEIQRFAYIVTHDLRAPLVNIMGFTSELEQTLGPITAYMSADDPARREAELANAQTAARDDLPEAIKFIRSSTRKMDGLINAILNLSREGRRTLSPVSINMQTLLETAAANVRHQLVEAGGEIAISGYLPPIVSDRLSLEQIFGNLLDNAVKYRAHARPLRIAIQMQERDDQRIIINVADNGRGIAASDHERIFDLFRRSGAQDQPGEGIGLAHVRTMIRNLGGEITLTSELDQGTTFSLIIPKDLRRVIKGAAT